MSFQAPPFVRMWQHRPGAVRTPLELQALPKGQACCLQPPISRHRYESAFESRETQARKERWQVPHSKMKSVGERMGLMLGHHLRALPRSLRPLHSRRSLAGSPSLPKSRAQPNQASWLWPGLLKWAGEACGQIWPCTPQEDGYHVQRNAQPGPSARWLQGTGLVLH